MVNTERNRIRVGDAPIPLGFEIVSLLDNARQCWEENAIESELVWLSNVESELHVLAGLLGLSYPPHSENVVPTLGNEMWINLPQHDEAGYLYRLVRERAEIILGAEIVDKVAAPPVGIPPIER